MIHFDGVETFENGDRVVMIKNSANNGRIGSNEKCFDGQTWDWIYESLTQGYADQEKTLAEVARWQ